jgi:hypothetical protein
MEEGDVLNLKEKREVIRRRAYLLMFEIFVIFGVPAGLAYFIGNYFINLYDLEKFVWIFFLFPSFVLGWVLFYFRFRKISNELKDINEKIKKQ